MTHKEAYYENLAESIIEKLAHRNMEGYYCKDREEANAKAKRFLTPDCSIAWGGSETLKEIGLLDDLTEAEDEYEIYDRKKPHPGMTDREFYGKMVTSDFFFMSSNAVTLNGELINIDGNGNRVACLCNGPENVIIIVGMNKIVRCGKWNCQSAQYGGTAKCYPPADRYTLQRLRQMYRLPDG